MKLKTCLRISVVEISNAIFVEDCLYIWVTSFFCVTFSQNSYSLTNVHTTLVLLIPISQTMLPGSAASVLSIYLQDFVLFFDFLQCVYPRREGLELHEIVKKIESKAAR